MTNSWLSTGGFLFVFFRIPMSTALRRIPLRVADALSFPSRWCEILWGGSQLAALPSRTGPGSYWMACHSSVSGRTHGERAAGTKERLVTRSRENSCGSLSPPRGTECHNKPLSVTVAYFLIIFCKFCKKRSIIYFVIVMAELYNL